MEPRRAVVSPPLQRWADQAAADERRAVVVRITAPTDPHTAADALAADGAEVRQVGQASVVAAVTPVVLWRVAAQAFVVAVEEPRRLFPRGGPR